MGDKSKDIGRIGEDIAASYLERLGYKIIERNFLCKIGELDIVAYDPKFKGIAVVEVKCRNTVKYGLPCEFVNSKKQHILKRTTEYYLMKSNYLQAYPIRMDIIEVLILKSGRYLRHIKNAF